jgi:hypothetical protein
LPQALSPVTKHKQFRHGLLTLFIAGLLFICASSTSITWERTPHPARRPAFSSHLITSVIPASSRDRQSGVLQINSHRFRPAPYSVPFSVEHVIAITACA